MYFDFGAVGWLITVLLFLDHQGLETGKGKLSNHFWHVHYDFAVYLEIEVNQRLYIYLACATFL